MNYIHRVLPEPRSAAASALIGAVALALSTTVSIGSAFAGPPSSSGRSAEHLSTFMFWYGLPAEFYGLLWFALVLVAVARNGSRKGGPWNFVFVTAVPVTGIILWICAARLRVLPVFPLLVASAAAVGILMISGALMSDWRDLPKHMWTELRFAVSNRSFCAVSLISIAAVMLGATGLRALEASTTTSEAKARIFRRWYLSAAEQNPQSTSAVGVVVFSDSTCPSCVAAARTAEALLDQFTAETRIQTDLVVRDLPVGGCKEATLDRASVPCLAAAAVRLVVKHRSQADVRRTVLWLSREYAQLSAARILDRLGGMGLSNAFKAQWPELWLSLAGDEAEASRLGVDSAPSIIVNGVRLPDTNASFLEEALRAERERHLR